MPLLKPNLVFYWLICVCPSQDPPNSHVSHLDPIRAIPGGLTVIIQYNQRLLPLPPFLYPTFKSLFAPPPSILVSPTYNHVSVSHKYPNRIWSPVAKNITAE